MISDVVLVLMATFVVLYVALDIHRSICLDRERRRIVDEVLRCHLFFAPTSADLADALVRIVHDCGPPVSPFVPTSAKVLRVIRGGLDRPS